MTLAEIPENTTAYLTVVPKDKTGTPQIPTTLSYLVIDLFSGNVLQPDTVLIPAVSVEIEIPASVNAIVDEKNRREIRRVITKSTFGVAGVANGKYDYNVVNLDQI